MSKVESAPRLPAANEFSSGQIKLKRVLELAAEHPGDRAALVEAIRGGYFGSAGQARADDPAAQREQQQKRAGNVVIGMVSYGLYDPKRRQLTDVGAALLKAGTDAERARGFAQHILTQRHGIEVIEAVRSLQSRGVAATKLALAQELRRRGFELPQATTHHTTLLNWLAEADVVSGPKRDLNDAVLNELVGATPGEVHAVLSLAPRQRAYLDAVHGLAAGRPPDIELTTRHVERVAIESYGEIFGPEDRRKALIRDPLQESGWIEVSGTGKGRGGKSGVIKPTKKLLDLDPGLLRRPRTGLLPADVLDKLDTPVAKAYEDLNSSDKHVKGLALELLAVNMAYDLGLTPVAFRLRAAETTGGTEVDLVAEGTRQHFSRWVFQCKNTASVDLKVATREIGVADLLHAHVVVIVTTGRLTRNTPAIRAALARMTPKQIVPVEGDVIERYQAGGREALLDHFRDCAHETMTTKREQGLRLLDEFSGLPS